MSLHPTMKRRLHERLHPLIGEEEADALLDEISPADPVTREWLQDRFDRIDSRFELVDERFERIDERFERIDERFERIDDRFGLVDERFERIDERFATKEWIRDYFYGKEVLDEKLESMKHELMGTMHRTVRDQAVLLVVLTAFLGGILSLAQIIWG